MKTGRSTRPRLHAPLLAALSAIFAVGCALTSKSEPLAPRYFSPERSGEVSAPLARAEGQPLELRLGRITSASYLDERLVYRDSAFELGYYQERRWTEEPAHYLERRMARVLFEVRGVRQVVGGVGPTLDLELIAFEEIRAPKPTARVGLVVKLRDQRLVRWEQTVTVDQAIGVDPRGDQAAALVEALGSALRAVVEQVADRVLIELAAPLKKEPRAAADRP